MYMYMYMYMYTSPHMSLFTLFLVFFNICFPLILNFNLLTLIHSAV